MPRAARTCGSRADGHNCPLKATNGPYCARHAAEQEEARGRRQERGYGAEHDAARRRAATEVATGAVECWRCGEPILADDEWDLGHDGERLAGPEHRGRCNRRAAALKGHGQAWTPGTARNATPPARPAPLSADQRQRGLMGAGRRPGPQKGTQRGRRRTS